jgi:hypothetical protein
LPRTRLGREKGRMEHGGGMRKAAWRAQAAVS